MSVRRALSRVNHDLDIMVARTPPHRDRYVDFLRVFAIGVVVAWHWSLSVLVFSDGRWVMPNPIHQVPGGWAATWLLQIMPVFFIVGGYANAAAWWAAQRTGAGPAGYYSARLRRLLVPIGVFAAAWLAFEAVMHTVATGYPGALAYGWIIVTPLWFAAAYLWVVLLTPLTATAHARARWLAIGLLGGAVIAADLGRFSVGAELSGWVNTALVWVFIHQLGYFYRDGTLGRIGWWGAAALVVAAVAALAALTSLDAYPRSMVATVGQERSNLLPTTATVAVVAILQLGVMGLVRAPVSRWLRRPGVWKPVIATNSVIMTIFLWHMTALVAVLAVLRTVGVTPRAEVTAVWWWERPFWLLAPVPVLLALIAVFGRFERATSA